MIEDSRLALQRWSLCLTLLLFPLAACFNDSGSSSSGGTTSEASGSTVFVASTNNTGKADGTLDHPFIGLADAIESAPEGSIIRIGSGVFEESTLLIEKPLQIVGDGAAQTTIMGDGVSRIFQLTNRAEEVVISDLTIRGGFDPLGSVIGFNRAQVTFLRCLFTDNRSRSTDGSDLPNSTAVVRVQANSSCLIDQCVFMNNDASAISSLSSIRVDIRNTLIAFQGKNGVFVRGNPDTLDPDVILENVTVSVLAGNGVNLVDFADARLTNCILESPAGNVRESTLSGDPILLYNTLRRTYVDIDSDQTLFDADQVNALTPPGTNRGNLIDNPRFVDADAGDFQLADDSPCIDAGDPQILDRDGSRSDMGAFGGPGGNLQELQETALDLAFDEMPPPDEPALRAAPFPSEQVVDWNQDGFEDSFRVTDAGALQVRWGMPHGTSRPAPSPRGLSAVQGIRLGDVNRDGETDLLVRTESSLRVFQAGSPRRRAALVMARPGDEVVLSSAIASATHRVWESGRLVLSVPPGEFQLRVLRDQQVVLPDTPIKAADVLVVPGNN